MNERVKINSKFLKKVVEKNNASVVTQHYTTGDLAVGSIYTILKAYRWVCKNTGNGVHFFIIIF